MQKTDAYFMKQALAQAQQALDAGEFPVGCVIADGSSVIAEGARRGSRGEQPNELDHAEIVALKRLSASAPCSDPGSLAIYCTMEPCLMCLGAIVLSGISRIVYAYEDVMGGGSRCPLHELPPLYSAARISIVEGVLRGESLALFRRFFSDPGRLYWKGSLLARYTLSQE
jgi:tRNA(adenine34) deaminase